MPSRPSPVRALRQLRPYDLRGAARLATQATAGISRVAEGVHQSGCRGAPRRGVRGA